MKFRNRKLLWVVLAIWVLVPPVHAQVLEEVVVTAQKREQSQSTVGISLTAFSGAQMKALGVTNTTQMSEQTPGLIVTDFGGGTTTVFNIRGSGQLDFNDQQEGPVAVYLDGAYQSFLSGVGFDFYDLDRMEVLRGSQGTLFGRNATAGLVQIISKKPTDKLEGYFEATAGDYAMREYEGAINLPINSMIDARLSLFHDTDAGYIKNSIGPNGGAKNNNSGRLQVSIKTNDNLSILLSGRFGIDHTGGGLYSVHAGITTPDGLIESVQPFGPVTPAQFVNYCSGLFAFNGVSGPAGGTRPGSGDCFNATSNGSNPFKVAAEAPSYFRRKHYEGGMTVDYKIGPGTLTSQTDYQDFRKRYADDSDSTPLNLWEFQQDLSAKQWSEELRYAADTSWGRYIGGLYYLSIHDEGRAAVDAIPTLGVSVQNFYGLNTSTRAAFGQIEYKINPILTAIVGARATEDSKTFHLDAGCGFDYLANTTPTADNCAFFAPQIQGTGEPSTRKSESNWSGNIELDATPYQGLLLYGKVVRGYKAGGFNGGIINFFDASAATYGAETPLTYEGGAKASFFDTKVRLSASLFHTDYRGFQTFTQNGANIVVFNVDAEMTGSEIELTLNPIKGLDILLGTSLLDAKQKNVFGPGGYQDRPMPNAPHATFNALAHYQWLTPWGLLGIQADMSYRGSRSESAVDQPALHGEPYAVVNGNLEWRKEDDRWSVKVWGKNLTNRTYFPTIFDLTTVTGQIEPVVAPPRWFGATVAFHF